MSLKSKSDEVIAILGCGSIGRRHIRNLLELGFRNLYAFDPSQDARRFVEKEFGVVTVSNLMKIWQRDPNIAFITSPPQFHIDLAIMAAQRGCHLFIEKPLAHKLSGLKTLYEELKAHQVVHMVACNMRFHPGPARIKKIIQSGLIGELLAARLEFCSYLPNWRPWQDYRRSYTASTEWGGAILDCIHEIDLALWYFGPGRLVASAHLPAKAIGLETDGLAEILIAHESGILSSIHVDFIQRDYHRTCRVTGSEGSIYWDFNKGQVQVFGKKGGLVNSFQEPQNWHLNEMYVDQIKHFMCAIDHGEETMNTIEEGEIALRLAMQARKRNNLEQVETRMRRQDCEKSTKPQPG